MFNYILGQFKESKMFRTIVAIFFLLAVYWIFIFATGFTDNPHVDYYTLIYPVLALIGGFVGLKYAKKWGGYKSVLGKAITYLSLGLLAQFVGQVLYNYYVFVLGVEVPYPSIGDVSYFASVILYVIGVIYLAKVSGIKLTLGTVRGKLFAILIPSLMLAASYLILLRGYEFADTGWAILFLDFGFPIGQAIFVSIALLVLLISKNILAGMMRNSILLLTFALIFQFISDFLFSYMYSIGSDVYIIDFLYAISYFLMAISLFSIGNMFYKVQES